MENEKPWVPVPPLVFYYNLFFSLGTIASLLSSIIVLRRTWYRRLLLRQHEGHAPTTTSSTTTPDSCQVLSTKLVSEPLQDDA